MVYSGSMETKPNTILDRSKASRLLAKCAAYIDCGKPDAATQYARELAAYLDAVIASMPQP